MPLPGELARDAIGTDSRLQGCHGGMRIGLVQVNHVLLFDKADIEDPLTYNERPR